MASHSFKQVTNFFDVIVANGSDTKKCYFIKGRGYKDHDQECLPEDSISEMTTGNMFFASPANEELLRYETPITAYFHGIKIDMSSGCECYCEDENDKVIVCDDCCSWLPCDPHLAKSVIKVPPPSLKAMLSISVLILKKVFIN